MSLFQQLWRVGIEYLWGLDTFPCRLEMEGASLGRETRVLGLHLRPGQMTLAEKARSSGISTRRGCGRGHRFWRWKARRSRQRWSLKFSWSKMAVAISRQ